MPCFSVPYTDRNGTHHTIKWANTPDEAKELVKKQRAGYGLTPHIGTPVEVPFGKEELKPTCKKNT